MKCLAITITAAALCFVGCDNSPKPADDEVVLYTALAAKVRALDPGDIGDTTSSSVASQIFECLYQYHYLKRPYELIPQLAESMPQVSDNGLTYTIRIKKGVYFTNDQCFEGGKGRQLKASDFVFAWKRIADIKYLSKNWWIFDNRVVGLDEFREYSKTCKTAADVDYSHPVEGLQTPDDHTLVIKLKKPWPQIVYLLAHLPTAAIAKEAVDHYGKDIINHPIGTGPFKLKLWHRGSFIELVRNKNFRTETYPSQGQSSDTVDGYLADAGKPMPFTDRIVMMLVQEDPPRWFLFLQGKIGASGIPKDNFNEAIDQRSGLTEEMKKRNIHLRIFRDPSTYWIGFNMEDPVLGKNKPLRRALACAVDRRKYIELFTNNRGEIPYGFVPPLMKSYDPEIKKTAKNFYDPQKARGLVKEAEKIYGGKLPKLILAVPGTDIVFRQRGEFLKRCFIEAGLNVEMDYMDWPTFQNKVKSKSAQMFMLGWIADYPDVENFLQLFYSKNASPGPNNFNYYNPTFDALYERVAVMHDSSERMELYRKAERLVIEDCPAIFLMHGVAFVLHHDWLENYKPHAFGYGQSKYRRINTEKRAAY
ncbi:MAG: ABC transporter substrate-binding protein [Planctomycetota bacterium]